MINLSSGGEHAGLKDSRSPANSFKMLPGGFVSRSIPPNPSFDQVPMAQQCLKRVCSISVLSSSVRLCCIVYLSMAFFLLVKGLQLKSENLFYQLMESATSHICVIFLTAFLLVALVMVSLYAVNSPMSP